MNRDTIHAVSEPPQVHDRFLKLLLSNPESAGCLLRERLPKDVAAILGPEPPELVDGTFVDGEFREHLTDRLFRMKTLKGEDALVYLVVEHKSYPDRRTAFQLLRYMSRIWERMAMEAPNWEQLPPIFPLVVYHGESEWRYPTEFADLLNVDKLVRPHCLDFRFTLVDLGRIEDLALSDQIRLRAGLLALKYAFRQGEQRQALEILEGMMADIPEDFRYPLLQYTLQMFAVMDLFTACRIIEQVHSKEEANMWLSKFAEDVMAEKAPELIDKGRQEGRQEEAATMLLRLMQRRFGTLPEWVASQVNSADTTTIEGWMERLFAAQKVEEVFNH
jgi:predicted transposase/invertase (TIGR01784 family)